MKHFIPEPFANKFTCVHCNTLTQQNWWSISWNGTTLSSDRNHLRVSTCQLCKEHTLWINNVMYYPDHGNLPLPNPLMPILVKKYYEEAASIFSKSPRGSAALLRLAIQVLMVELGEQGKDINTDIKNLVIKGLPERIKQALDLVRVTGNEAVHPGLIDTDDPMNVNHMFSLVNIIIEYMIEMPLKISTLYDKLPESKIVGIDQRDKKK